MMLRLWGMSETTQVQSLAVIEMPKMLATLPLPPPHHCLWPAPSLSSTFSLGSVTQQGQSQFFHHSSACPFPYQIIEYLFFHILKLFSRCIGLNKNDPPHWLIYLNTSSSVSGTVWKGMRVVTVRRGSVLLGVSFEVSKTPAIYSVPLARECVSRGEFSASTPVS